MDVEKILIGDDEEEFPAIARLIELGRQKSYITLDDILHFFPEAEQDVEQLEEAFSALLSAGIPFVEDAVMPEPTEDELVAVEESGEAEPEPAFDLVAGLGEAFATIPENFSSLTDLIRAQGAGAAKILLSTTRGLCQKLRERANAPRASSV